MRFFVCFSCVLFFAFSMSGCRGCSEKKAPKDASVKAVKPKPALLDAGTVQPAIEPHAGLVTPGGPQKAAPGKPLGLNKMPGVGRREIEQDPRLDNPNLPYASKRTLKMLEKLQKSNPKLTKPDDWYKADPDADTRKGQPPTHP